MSAHDRNGRYYVRSPSSPLMSRLSREAGTFYLRSQPYAEEKEEKEKLVRYIMDCGKYLESLMKQKLVEFVRSKKRGKGSKPPPLSATSSMSSVSTNGSGDDLDRVYITNDPAYGEEQFLETMFLSGIGMNTPSPSGKGRGSNGGAAGGGNQVRAWTMFVFGSESTGTSCRDSDIDMGICVNFVHCRRDKKYLLYELATIIGSNDQDGVLMIKPLLSAKYPIIRITQNKMGIKIDVSIADTYCQTRNNYIDYIIGEFGSKRYGHCPIRELIVFIKHWSKEQGINNAYQCYLNSFGFTMLAIKFLQFYMTSHIEAQRPINVDLGHLIAEFFKFYAEHFDPNKHAISIADPTSGTFDNKTTECWMEINDPMNPQNNIAENVGWSQCQRIQHEFRCATDLITKHRHLERAGYPGMDHDHFDHISLFALLVNADLNGDDMANTVEMRWQNGMENEDEIDEEVDHRHDAVIDGDDHQHDEPEEATSSMERAQSPESTPLTSLSQSAALRRSTEATVTEGDDRIDSVTESDDSKRGEGMEGEEEGDLISMEHDLKEISKEIEQPMTYDSIHSDHSRNHHGTVYLYPINGGGHKGNGSHRINYDHSYYDPYSNGSKFQKGAFRSNGREEPRYIDHDEAAQFNMFPHRRSRRDRRWR